MLVKQYIFASWFILLFTNVIPQTPTQKILSHFEKEFSEYNCDYTETDTHLKVWFTEKEAGFKIALVEIPKTNFKNLEANMVLTGSLNSDKIDTFISATEFQGTNVIFHFFLYVGNKLSYLGKDWEISEYKYSLRPQKIVNNKIEFMAFKSKYDKPNYESRLVYYKIENNVLKKVK